MNRPAGLALSFALMLSACGPPDFSAIEDTEARKAAFVAHLCPIIEEMNQAEARLAAQAERADEAQLRQIAEELGLTPDVEVQLLADRVRNRIGAIPPRLALAQAALESGWGTSELAQKANNLFGRRCFYVEDCVTIGEVQYRRFGNFESALELYYKDMNQLLPYKRFRDLRRADKVNFGLERTVEAMCPA